MFGLFVGVPIPEVIFESITHKFSEMPVIEQPGHFFSQLPTILDSMAVSAMVLTHQVRVSLGRAELQWSRAFGIFDAPDGRCDASSIDTEVVFR